MLILNYRRNIKTFILFPQAFCRKIVHTLEMWGNPTCKIRCFHLLGNFCAKENNYLN